MHTIQVREVPNEAYEVIRRRAASEGKSLQAYMRDLLVELAARPSKAEAVETVKRLLARYGGAGSTPEQIVADVRAGRR